MANYLALIGGLVKEVTGLVASAGAADAGKIVQLDSTGKLDNSVMPTGVGAADVNLVQATEALAAGDLVNVYDSGSGAYRARKADASSANAGKRATGFVLAAVTSGNNATVYSEGTDTQVTGLTGSDLWLSGSTPGAVTTTAPTTSGYTVQRVGTPQSATSFNFQQGDAYIRA